MGNELQILPGGGEIINLPAVIGDVTKCAAQYVRMSTEHQKYSTENQSAAILEYAGRHGLTVVRTYADRGRSGLRLDGRPALQQLLADVRTGDAPFRFLLVFDISRWGRFQDADESAYYEYFCKAAGLQVRYCAEHFENDGSLSSSLIKHIKRLMAAEYSRELSAKVFVGACRMVRRGFKQGGPPGFGLRRLLVDEHSRPKGFLEPGQQKSIQTDRILLVPGPDEEIRIVREIFRLFVSERMLRSKIARLLNRKGIVNEFGRHWTKYTVAQVLTNEKYIGNYLYNRRSYKLKLKVVKNPPESWVRADGALEPLVDVETFRAARRIVDTRLTRISDEEALRRLRLCLAKRGHLSATIINNTQGVPSVQTYKAKFGSLDRAFEMVGGKAEWAQKWGADRKRRSFVIRRAIMQKAIESIESDRGHVCKCTINGPLLVDGTFSVSVKVLSGFRLKPAGLLQWEFVVMTPADIVLAVRMEKDTDSMMDYYLLPRSLLKTKTVCLASKMTRWEENRFTSFDGLLGRLYKIQMEEYDKQSKRVRETRTVSG